MPGILTLIAVLLLGFSLGYTVKKLLVHHSSYSGTIYVTESGHKTLYSLELTDYPETLMLKKQVVFKVDASDPSLIRE